MQILSLINDWATYSQFSCPKVLSIFRWGSINHIKTTRNTLMHIINVGHFQLNSINDTMTSNHHIRIIGKPWQTNPHVSTKLTEESIVALSSSFSCYLLNMYWKSFIAIYIFVLFCHLVKWQNSLCFSFSDIVDRYYSFF